MARRSTRTKTGFEKSISRSDSGVENSKMRPAWKRRLKPFLRSSKRWSRRAWQCLACGADTGNRAYQREPSGRASRRGGHLIHGVLRTARRAVGAEGAADAGVEQAQEIVALGGGGDGGARVARGVLLADGDGGSDAVDVVHVGLLHALQELAGVGGERFHVAALAFGVDGVEGERGLARSRTRR